MIELGYAVNDGELVIDLCERIDTNNAPEVEERIAEIIEANPAETVTLDADNLEYISSAGLRLIIKTLKGTPSLRINNASRDVYEIFEQTGIESLLPVKRRPREISVEGLEMIGKGGNGSVYRLDDETVLKLYGPEITMEMLEAERDTAQKAFLMGVPTIISFDVVKSDGANGLVYELVDSNSLMAELEENKDRQDETLAPRLGKVYADMLRSISEVDATGKGLPDEKDVVLERLEFIKDSIEPEVYEMVKRAVGTLPDGHSFIHADLNPGNLMSQGDDYVFIDMAGSGVGHPIFNFISAAILLSSSFGYKLDPSFPSPNFGGITVQQMHDVWRAFLREYFGDVPEETLDEFTEALFGYTDMFTYVTLVYKLVSNNIPFETRQIYIDNSIESMHKAFDDFEGYPKVLKIVDRTTEGY